MARKALFATNDQPAQQAGEDQDLNIDQGAAASSQQGAAASLPAKKRAIVSQTPEQRRAALGIDEDLLAALQDNADEQTIDECLREQAASCGELSLQHLTQAGHISGSEAQSILESYGYYVDDVKSGQSILDVLAFHVWVKLDTKDQRAEKEIRNLTAQLASIVPSGVTHCAFPRLSDASAEVYEKFPLAEKICATLMCPIIQAHERDFVSVASVNPVTAATVGVLLEHIMEREGVSPFTFVLTMNAGAWSDLCAKQFASDV